MEEIREGEVSEALQQCDFRYGVGGSEDGGSSHQGVSPGISEQAGVLTVDTPVDLDEGLGSGTENHLLELPHLLDGMWDELLSAETGIHTHDEDDIDLVEDVFEDRDWSGGIDGDAGLHALGVDMLEYTMEMVARLVMNTNQKSPNFGKAVDEFFGMHNHEVQVERLFGTTRNGLDSRQSEGDVGDKNTVHHVNVQPIAWRGIEHGGGFVEPAEIGTQHRGRNYGHGRGVYYRKIYQANL